MYNYVQTTPFLFIILQTTPQKEKGRINLADVRAVEEVDGEALGNKPNAFQVRGSLSIGSLCDAT